MGVVGSGVSHIVVASTSLFLGLYVSEFIARKFFMWEDVEEDASEVSRIQE